MVVIVEKCESRTSIAVPSASVSFEVTKKKGRKDETYEKKAYELFLKHFQVFCEGFVCPLIVDQDFENIVVVFFYIFACKVKQEKAQEGLRFRSLPFCYFSL